MGLLDVLFKPKVKDNLNVNQYFQGLTSYRPVFHNYNGSIYEMAQTRTAIHTIASNFAKFNMELVDTEGSNAKSWLVNVLKYQPNEFMDSYKFLYRLCTILLIHNNAFIVPIEDMQERIVGYYPILPTNTEILEDKGVLYLKYSFLNGQKAVIEYNKVGIVNRHQYDNDFFGSNNNALNTTLDLIEKNNQGIVEGIKNSATIRFMGKLNNVYKSENIKAERNRFVEDNLSSSNDSGLLLFDNKYSDIKQIDSKPFIVDSNQMEIINQNVYSYYGVNKNIIQNKFSEDEWNAFYEGVLEPIAIQVGLVLTNMTFTNREKSFGNNILLTSNRLQYASNNTKLLVSQQLFDRGILNRNQVLDIWNLPHVKDGDTYYIRKEYADVDNLDKPIEDSTNEGGSDEIT